MVDKWDLQSAENCFEEVIEKAINRGPQLITDQGEEKVVILSVEAYHRLAQRQTDLVDFFRNSPLNEIEIDLKRKKDLPREDSGFK